MTEEYPDAPMVCAELYQVIGYLAFHFDISDHPDVVKAMENACEHSFVHKDLLPVFSSIACNDLHERQIVFSF